MNANGEGPTISVPHPPERRTMKPKEIAAWRDGWVAGHQAAPTAAEMRATRSELDRCAAENAALRRALAARDGVSPD